MSEQLTPRQELFCREYIIDYNGKQAAARAGYSEKSAETQAARLLRNDKVLSRVRELQAEQVKRLSISADWVILKLKETLDQSMAAVQTRNKSAKWNLGNMCSTAKAQRGPWS